MPDSHLAFDATSARYQKGNAWWMAKLSELSYEGEDEPNVSSIESKLKEMDSGFESVQGFAKDSSQGIVVEHRSFVTAAFRGTDEIGDWLDNVNALAVDHALGEVHRGFQGALMDVWPKMKSAIRSIRNARPKEEHRLPLYITGHSLGGAMATLAAAELISADEPFYSVYTYGQPRAGDRAFSRVYNSEAGSRSFRFQNNNDIVTRVPARVMGYSHVGTYIYIDEDKKLSSDPGSWYRFLDGVRGVVKDIGEKGLDSVTDHKIGNYVEAIGLSREGLPD